jgi:phosphate-selective porin OprO/OprP
MRFGAGRAGLATAAGVLGVILAARPCEAGDAGDGKTETERRLDEVLAELESQRMEIRDLKSRLSATAAPAQGGVEEAVKKYLESEDGQKTLGRGKEDFRAFWKEGLNFETKDKGFTFKVAGRLMFDVVDPDADRDLETLRGDWDRGNRVRRGRVELAGTMYRNAFFKFDVEFGATPHVLRDAYVGLKGVPVVGNVQVGVMKEPAGLEQLTSAKWTTFLERSFADSLVRNFNPGVMVFDEAHGGRLAWAVGVFGDDDSRGTGPVGNNLTARIAGAPVLSEDGSRLLHVGASVQARDPESRNDRLQSRGDVSLGPQFLDTGLFSVDASLTLGLEAAWKQGPFSVQGEWLRYTSREYRGAADLDPTFHAWYVQVSYFLTGEDRPWKSGVFQRVKPRTNFDGSGGVGAWELAFRLGRADFQSDGVAGGRADQWTAGANWYLNPNARVMLNVGRQHLVDFGAMHFVSMRFQVDF